MPTNQHHPVVSALLQDQLKKNTKIRLRVISDSMAPVLNTGDWIQVEPVKSSAIGRGNIVLLPATDHFLTHRVVALNSTGCLTKGDNCLKPDPWVDRAEIFGQVSTRERQGKIQKIANHPRWSGLIGIISFRETKFTIFHPRWRYPFRIITRIMTTLLIG
jgi:signal peptidase I